MRDFLAAFATTLCAGIFLILWHALRPEFLIIFFCCAVPPFLKERFLSLFGFGEPYPTKDSESGIGTATSIVGMYLTNVLTFHYASKGTDYLKLGSDSLYIYWGGLVLVLGMVAGMLGATKLDKNGEVIRTFDKGTRRFLGWFAIFWVVIIGGVYFTYAGLSGKLITQSPKIPLRIEGQDKYKFELGDLAGAPGIQFTVTFGPDDFKTRANPPSLDFRVKIDDGVNREWRLANVIVGNKLDNSGEDQNASWVALENERARPSLIREDEYESGKVREVIVFWPELKPKEQLRMAMRLFPRGFDGMSDDDKILLSNKRDELLSQLRKEPSLIEVTALVPTE